MHDCRVEFGVFAIIRWVYVAISPLPLLLFAALFAYINGLEGWGAWLPVLALVQAY